MYFDDQRLYFDDLRDTIFDYRGTKKYKYIFISAVKVTALITLTCLMQEMYAMSLNF